MNRDLLKRLVAAGQRHEPAVLLRGLGNGYQVLIDDSGIHGDVAEIPAQLIERGREALARDGAITAEYANEHYLLQTFSSAPRLIIVGAVHIAQALIPMARIAGYEVQLIDPRTAFASSARFPNTEISHDWPTEALQKLSPDSRTAVITLSHDAKIDDPHCRLRWNPMHFTSVRWAAREITPGDWSAWPNWDSGRKRWHVLPARLACHWVDDHRRRLLSRFSRRLRSRVTGVGSNVEHSRL